MVARLQRQATLWRRGERYSFTYADALWLIGQVGNLQETLGHEHWVREPGHEVSPDPNCPTCRLLDPHAPWFGA